ncbi:MAG: Hsp20/alpha crystallin family protein [Planctomycetota bacterium]
MLSSQSAFAQMNRLRDEIDRAFGVDSKGWNRSPAAPPVNIWEDDNGFYVEVDVPGLSMENLEIFVQESDELSIKGSRPEREIEGHWHHREHRGGDFERTIKLSDAVDVESVEAELTNGVLTIKLPKSESVKPRRIDIKTS